jgi:hypothetical protein
MAYAGHCRHCFGDCDGGCLIPGGGGLCIHQPRPRRPLREYLPLLRTRGLWRRWLKGIW